MLAHIGTVPWVGEAWLSRDGNFLVVLPRAGAPTGDEVAGMVLEAGRPAVLLADVNRDTVLALFAEREGWMQADTLVELTAEEAERVARRILGRVEARVTLDAETRSGLSEIVRRRFYAVYAPRADGSMKGGDPTGRILADARRVLDPPTIDALRDAVASGYGPVGEEE